MLGAERNDRRGLRRLQRPTLQYIRPEEEDHISAGRHISAADDDVSLRWNPGSWSEHIQGGEGFGR